MKGFDTPDQLTSTALDLATADGQKAVGRYISGGGQWKHLTAAEVRLCEAKGFALWFIDEGTGDAAQFASGEAGGLAAGKKAAQAAIALGAPEGIPIYVGVDFDAGARDVSNIAAYMRGYKAGCAPFKAGMYADGYVASAVPTDVGDFMPGASGWQDSADYINSGNVAILQHPPTKMFGLDIDPCDVLDESVLWRVGAAATSAPVAPAAPPPPLTPPTVPSRPTSPFVPPSTIPHPDVDIMPPLEVFQTSIGVEPDGIYGPQTDAALTHVFDMVRYLIRSYYQS